MTVGRVLIAGLAAAVSFGTASASDCLDFAGRDLVVPGFYAMHQQPTKTDAVQESCRDALRRSPNDAAALLQLGRAQIAAGQFAEADATLAKPLLRDDGSALRMRGFMAEAGLVGPEAGNEKAARVLYRRAAQHGDVVAEEAEALLLIVPALASGKPPPAEALRMLQDAANRKLPSAMDQLASLIEKGAIPGGTAEDAVALAREAADLGLAAAMLRLSLYYQKGYGVPANMQTAREWADRAVAVTHYPLNLPVPFATFPPAPGPLPP